MSTKLYMATRGSYSDYSVAGIFSSRMHAQMFMDAFDGEYVEWNEIVEITLDPHVPEIADGRRPYFVRMSRDGNATEARLEDSPYGYTGSEMRVGFDISKNLYANVMARDSQHAIKIVNEKRAQLIAEGKWP